MTFVMPMVRIRLKCADVDSFVDKYHADVDACGVFVRTRSPLATGTPICFEFRLADDSCLFRGAGSVLWARSDVSLAPLLDAGMMLGFGELRDGTRENFERVLARKRAIDEAADTAPTLVRPPAGDGRPLPMTTKLTADELDELRGRMRAEMAADGEVAAPPVELAGEVASPVEPSPVTEPSPASEPPPSLLPTLVPAAPREPIDARPVPAAATPGTPLAKILVMRPRPAAPDDRRARVERDDATPLPPVARAPAAADASPTSRGEVTELVAWSSAERDQSRFLGAAAFSTLAIGFFLLVRSNVAQRILEWLTGA